MVKWHNVHVWGIENSRITLKHERNPPTLNVLYAISKKVYSHFFFMENPIIGNIRLRHVYLVACLNGKKIPMTYVPASQGAT
jgi:hypothetical protein